MRRYHPLSSLFLALLFVAVVLLVGTLLWVIVLQPYEPALPLALTPAPTATYPPLDLGELGLSGWVEYDGTCTCSCLCPTEGPKR